MSGLFVLKKQKGESLSERAAVDLYSVLLVLLLSGHCSQTLKRAVTAMEEELTLWMNTSFENHLFHLQAFHSLHL